MRTAAAAFAALAALSACGGDSAATRPGFPAADRPVSSIVSIRWSDEAARDRVGEAEQVMDLAGIHPGMAVADIGAGDGYYAVRLARRVGPEGRVFAEDILPEARRALDRRVAAEGLTTVAVILGQPDDPMLPPASLDRALMVHMYHEIASPYAFLWRLRPALKPGGQVAIVDADRPTNAHGTPPALLDCEMAAVGYARVAHHRLKDDAAYITTYEARGPRPEPGAIRACRL